MRQKTKENKETTKRKEIKKTDIQIRIRTEKECAAAPLELPPLPPNPCFN